MKADNVGSKLLCYRRKRRQIRLGVIMSMTVFEFFTFQLPWSAMVVTSFLQKSFGELTMGTEMSTIAILLWWVDSSINPLWVTFLTKSRQPAFFNSESSLR